MSSRCAAFLAGRVCMVGLLWLALAAAMAGCQSPPAPLSRRPGTDADPCAERLHEICGHLLLYCSLNGRLPGDLADLASVGPSALPPLVCPASQERYVYDPQGPAVPAFAGRAIVYDATPCHGGMRWAIVAEVPAAGKPLTARVVLLPDGPTFSGERTNAPPTPRAK